MLIMVNFFQMIMCFNDWISISVSWNVTPMAHMNAGHPRTVQTSADEDVILASVKVT
jgi:hypothetical protein